MRSNLQLRVYCLAVSATAILLSGCAPRRNQGVERVQNDLVALSGNPAIASSAPLELKEAEMAVNRAQESWSRTGNRDEAEHLTYLAQKRIEIARVRTNQMLADREANQLSQARDVAGTGYSRDIRRAEARASIADASVASSRIALADRQMEIDRLKMQLNDLQTRESTTGLTLTLGDVFFEANRSELKPGGTRKMLPLLEFLRSHPQEKIVIEGHTDNSGSAALNRELSTRRAEVVRDFLTSEGIAPSRISTQGLGEQFPITSNASEAGRLQNRRVEITIQALRSR